MQEKPTLRQRLRARTENKASATGVKLPLLALALGLAALGLFRWAQTDRARMDAFIERVSMPYKRLFSALADPLPFSLAELLCTLGVLWLLWLLVRTVRQMRAGHRVLARRLVSLAALAVWIYALVCGAWGVHYYGTSFAQKAGLVTDGMTVEQLHATAVWFAERVNETAHTVPRDENGRFCVEPGDILADTAGLYAGITEEYPFLDGPDRRAKPAFYSLLMSAANFTGYIFPPLGESTLNVDAPAVFLPVTVAHEFAHQRGVAAEQEANFVGVAACVASGRPVYVYSGYLFGYLHLANALYGADYALWEQTGALLCPEAIADFEANNAYWDRFEGLTAQVMETTYDAFLQGYGQELGIRSYGACVDLLVARYCPL
ncbi:MAG: DUF3810 domain-containing protein [Oscillospiraceae bacterium]|nr:DUF3810 domain-containing protein [Oscillospiraceae bacterium]